MTTRTIGLLATLAVALAAAVAVATSSSETTAKPAEAPAPPREPTVAPRAKAAPNALTANGPPAGDPERPGPPKPRRDFVQRITPELSGESSAAAASGGAAPRPARRPIPADAEASAAEAHRSFQAGDFAQARDAADAYLVKAGRDPAMLRIAAVSACALGDAAGAERYLGRNDLNLRASVTLACAEHGVRISGPEKREPRKRTGPPQTDKRRGETP